jgi:hypothetical protein
MVTVTQIRNSEAFVFTLSDNRVITAQPVFNASTQRWDFPTVPQDVADLLGQITGTDRFQKVMNGSVPGSLFSFDDHALTDHTGIPGVGDPRHASPVQTVQDLRDVPPEDRVDQQLRLLEDNNAVYAFDEQGLGADDGNLIIVPTDITPPDPGRWFKTAGAVVAHAASHEDAGDDEINVGGLSGELADPQPPKDHKDEHKSGGGDAFAAADILEATVKRVQTTTGPTTLLMGAVADGEYLKRSGTGIVGTSISAGFFTDGVGTYAGIGKGSPAPQAGGTDSLGHGSGANADGNSSFAQGYYAVAQDNSFAQGYYAQCTGPDSFAQGYKAYPGQRGFAQGRQVYTNGGLNSFAQGYNVSVNTNYSFAQGSGVTVTGSYSFAQGKNHYMTGSGQLTAGVSNRGTSPYALVHGAYNNANGGFYISVLGSRNGSYLGSSIGSFNFIHGQKNVYTPYPYSTAYTQPYCFVQGKENVLSDTGTYTPQLGQGSFVQGVNNLRDFGGINCSTGPYNFIQGRANLSGYAPYGQYINTGNFIQGFNNQSFNGGSSYNFMQGSYNKLQYGFYSMMQGGRNSCQQRESFVQGYYNRLIGYGGRNFAQGRQNQIGYSPAYINYDNFVQGSGNKINHTAGPVFGNSDFAVGKYNYVYDSLGICFAHGYRNKVRNSKRIMTQGYRNYIHESYYASVQGDSNRLNAYGAAAKARSLFIQGKSNNAYSAYGSRYGFIQGGYNDLYKYTYRTFMQGWNNKIDYSSFDVMVQGYGIDTSHHQTRCFFQGASFFPSYYLTNVMAQGTGHTLTSYSSNIFQQGLSCFLLYSSQSNCFMQGDSVTAANRAFGQGQSIYAKNYSFAQGRNASAFHDICFAQGYNVTAQIGVSFAQGYNTDALGARSFAQGRKAEAKRADQKTWGSNRDGTKGFAQASHLIKHVSTTDATETTLATLDLESGRSYAINVKVTGKNVTTNGEAATFEHSGACAFRDAAGSVLIGGPISLTKTSSAQDPGPANAAFVSTLKLSGNNVLLTVTADDGDASGDDYEWCCDMHFVEVHT